MVITVVMTDFLVMVRKNAIHSLMVVNHITLILILTHHLTFFCHLLNDVSILGSGSVGKRSYNGLEACEAFYGKSNYFIKPQLNISNCHLVFNRVIYLLL